MSDFESVPEVLKLLESHNVQPRDRNFEDVYSGLACDPKYDDLCASLDQVVFKYFESLALPDFPTIYDHLIVSLRPKDFIATFNWDPFLIQAARRHAYLGEKPRLLFLHGNVMHGYCSADDVNGIRGQLCSRCQKPFEAGRLLFPITKKDYESDLSIRASWNTVKKVMKDAFMLTVFGYSAPQSDQSAVEMLKQAWRSSGDKTLEQTEIIDIRPEDDLTALWHSFIHSHHYEVHSNFYDSWIAKHPRRTGEAYWDQYMEALFIEDNRIPRDASFDELREWLSPLLIAERQYHQRK